MAISGFTDFLSGATGQAASAIAPNVSNLKKSMAFNAYQGQKAFSDYARQRDRNQLRFDDAVRQLPQMYNQRGLVDSGQFQRGGNRLLRDYATATTDLRRDLDFTLQGLGLQDFAGQLDLNDLKAVLGTQGFQEAIANALKNQGMA